MKTVVLWGLVALNVLLIGALVDRHIMTSTALAQPAGRVSDYLTIPGHLAAYPDGVMFVLDADNHRLTGMTFDVGHKQTLWLPGIDLNKVFAAATPAVPPKTSHK